MPVKTTPKKYAKKFAYASDDSSADDTSDDEIIKPVKVLSPSLVKLMAVLVNGVMKPDERPIISINPDYTPMVSLEFVKCKPKISPAAKVAAKVAAKEERLRAKDIKLQERIASKAAAKIESKLVMANKRQQREAARLVIKLETKVKSNKIKELRKANRATAKALIIKKKRGRRHLSESEKQISKLSSKLYLKNYYKNNPDKYRIKLAQTYADACIYKLTSPDCKKYVIGSTILPLQNKLELVLARLNKTTVKNKLIKVMKDAGGVNWSISPLVKVPLKSEIELFNLEQIYISSYQTDILNINRRYCMESIIDIMKSFPTEMLPLKAQKFLKNIKINTIV
jgi:hypothetical protein